MVKKSRKLVEATDAVLEGISALFDREEVAGLLISAGPTPINPREAYILRVEPPAANEPVLDEQAAKKAESGVARSLVRTMVTCGLDQLDLQTMPTKIYVLALIKADSTRPFDAGGGDTDTPQSWMPKQSFTPKLRRCRPVLITVGTKGFCTQPCPTELAGVATSPEGGEGHDGVRTLVQETGVVPETAGGGGSQESEGESAFWWVQHAQVMRGLPRESRE
ncbi:hypothetical protein T484DRAFT_1741671 [Baffinella frigidus]|nr:hypothetical protein T484DRAFT_1741671 [Cryptophyta sp. CCMP2293]